MNTKNEEKLAELKLHQLATGCRINEIEKLIAEESKPKLQHGRCGVTSDGFPYITIGYGKNAVVYIDDGSSLISGVIQNGLSSKGGRIYFNVFDDIKAISKPLEWFKIVCATEDGSSLAVEPMISENYKGISIDIDGAAVYIKDEDFHDFITKLRRIELTRKNNA